MHRILYFFCVLFSFNGVLQAASGAMEIGTRRELFVDPSLIAELKGAAELRIHHPVREDIALVHDAPWEGNGCGYHTVFKDGELYRMYYKAWQISLEGDKKNPVVICYAESTDGIKWVKPDLGLHEFGGSTENNIVLVNYGKHGAHDFSPFIDKNPAASPDARYKAIGRPRELVGAMGFSSADAIHWKPIQEDCLVSEPEWAFDSQNVAFWSEEESQYVMYYRKVVDEIRHIARATSGDFQHWKKDGLIDFMGKGPSEREQFYTNQIRPYYRAPHLYLGFPARYVDRGWTESTETLPSPDERRRRAKANSRYGSAVTDSLLIASRDGHQFFRWDEAFLRPGLRTMNNWAYGDNYLAWNIIETRSVYDDSPSELSLYATESYFTGTSSRLRRYSLRMDGFASVYAPAQGGEVITQPVLFSGSSLRLNFSTSAAGSVQVELQDVTGKALPGFALQDCYEIFGDSTDRRVEWKTNADLKALEGIPVLLRLVLREADIYAFRFHESANPSDQGRTLP